MTLLGYLFHGGDPPRVIRPLNPNDPERLPEGITKKVLIVGGGLAGLSAGLELVERGYDVTIKEKNEELGGRLMTEEIKVEGQTFHIEHGFHGIKKPFSVFMKPGLDSYVTGLDSTGIIRSNVFCGSLWDTFGTHDLEKLNMRDDSRIIICQWFTFVHIIIYVCFTLTHNYTHD